jgi:hypothetical protein
MHIYRYILYIHILYVYIRYVLYIHILYTSLYIVYIDIQRHIIYTYIYIHITLYTYNVEYLVIDCVTPFSTGGGGLQYSDTVSVGGNRVRFTGNTDW